MANISLGVIIEKISSNDKDYRYMATSDLLNELSKDTFKADGDMEQRICQLVLKQLDDTSGDISGLAVKCLGLLVRKVGSKRVEELVHVLCKRLVTATSKQENMRDTASMGLKTMVAAVPGGEIAATLANVATPELRAGLVQPNALPEVKSECLEILHDILYRFGSLVSAEHEKLKEALLPELDCSRAGIRKRAIHCLSVLGISLNDSSLADLNGALVMRIKGPTKADLARTYIQAAGALSRSVGYRFGRYLSDCVPLLIKYCQEASEGDDELREICLQALESFVIKCPREIEPCAKSVTKLALEYLRYDPNYADDMEEDDEANPADEEDDAIDSDAEYSDDEDTSWKVRRASSKCISALFLARPDLMVPVYQETCTLLISRLREREESVKLDIFATFADVLRQTASLATLNDNDTCLVILKEEVPRIVKTLVKELRAKSVKPKVASFTLLQELVAVVPESLATHVELLSQVVRDALTEKSANSYLKMEALVFIKRFMESTPPTAFLSQLDVLVAPVTSAVADRYYKVAAEALRACGQLIKIIRPSAAALPASKHVAEVYACVSSRLSAQDQDQEVKEAAILCLGVLLSTVGDHLPSELPKCLSMLVERLRNEITRLTAVKAWFMVAESKISIDLSSVLQAVMFELITFLRKANRPLRHASLTTLESLVTGPNSAKIDEETINRVLTEGSALVSEEDLHISALALVLGKSVLSKYPMCVATVSDTYLPRALTLVASPLVQGQTLAELKSFFASLAQVTAGQGGTDNLQKVLLEQVSDSSSKQSLVSVAHCVAELCVVSGAEKCSSTVNGLVERLPTVSIKLQQVYLFCIGEVGRRMDLGSQQGVESTILNAFDSESEEVKSAAAQSLGSIAVGNHTKYLPYILKMIDTKPKLQYLLLHSIKEVISADSVEGEPGLLSQADVRKVLGLLFSYSGSEEEGVRNVVSECLGKLALLKPDEVLPKLEEALSPANTSGNGRATIVTAVRFTIVDKPADIDSSLAPRMETFLLLQDQDRRVRRAAVQTLNTAAHNKPSLVIAQLPALLPHLYHLTEVREDLIRTVDLGPFKHKIDDGLEIRIAAFDCMYTVLCNCLAQIDTQQFVRCVVRGLKDHYDIKMACHLILSKMAAVAPDAVLQVVNDMVEPLEKTLNQKLKSDAVKQEVDRKEDMIRSTLRAVEALSRLPDIDSKTTFVDFMNRTVKSGSMATKFQAVRMQMDEEKVAWH